MNNTLFGFLGVIGGLLLSVFLYLLGKKSSNCMEVVKLSKSASNKNVGNIVDLASRRATLLEKYNKLTSQAQTFADNAEKLDSDSIDELTDILDSAINLSKELSEK